MIGSQANNTGIRNFNRMSCRRASKRRSDRSVAASICREQDHRREARRRCMRHQRGETGPCDASIFILSRSSETPSVTCGACANGLMASPGSMRPSTAISPINSTIGEYQFTPSSSAKSTQRRTRAVGGCILAGRLTARCLVHLGRTGTRVFVSAGDGDANERRGPARLSSREESETAGQVRPRCLKMPWRR
jgi:hypothetical protein